MTDEVVTRLHHAIVDALHQRGVLEGPIRLADLYREIVPYRAVRSSLDVDLNADYEHALLRLLAGERGLLRVEPRAVRDALRKEAEAPYPDVGRFRSFADAEVWVTLPDTATEPPHSSDSTGAASGSGSADPANSSESAGASHAVRAQTTEGETAAVRPDAGEEHRAEEPTEGGERCPFCQYELPVGRDVRFCPGCGVDQRMRPCPECGELLEDDWRFCIGCGREA
jgi:hypothetical protein